MLKFITAALAITLTAYVQADPPIIDTEDNQYNFVGLAYDLTSGELLYTEHHEYLNSVTHEVKYKEINGDLFASKIVDYQQSFYSPNILQTNDRNGEVIDIKRDNKNSNNQVTIRYKESTNDRIGKGQVDYSSNLIIDTGFNQFIIRNWDALVNSNDNNGKEMTIDYVIPSELDHYELSIKKEPCDQDNNHYCFSISASSFFINLFSSDLKLTYNKTESTTPRLISFQGRSNISDSKGNYQDVKITYQYGKL